MDLRAVAQIEILGESIVLPAAAVLDAGAAPEAGGPVEIKEAAAAAARGLLEHEMPIQEHGLHAGEQGVGAVQVAPAGLDHANLGIGEKVDRLAEQVRRRHEVGIKDEDEIALAGLKPFLERAGLEADAILAVDQLDIEPRLPEPVGLGPGDIAGLIRGIVEHLDLQQLARVIELADAFQKPLHDVELIEDGKLDGDRGEAARNAARAWEHSCDA